ncbi:hypothetical protein SAMN05421505_12544 [Sinosporangium album]|uniref:Actinobacteria/chloroflexi VLRF1 release factor domain-containing protein n=1 Tax=Sinosporangium album TaxID=504805 RepID=A0A1G8G1G7_9ACTN|nr:hypothetical protein SAMN05421505_12544 [Sinosporangium album]
MAPERLAGWLRGFAERHGPPAVSAGSATVVLRGADGELAECHVPFPPLAVGRDGEGLESDTIIPGGGGFDPLLEPHTAALVEHALRPRRVGVVLVRLGGHAVGVFEGAELVVSKVGARLVQGRTAAGGWSQRRFARRRANQAAQARESAADTVARVLVPHLDGLAGVVLGGDRRSVEVLRGDRRLSGVFAREVGDFLPVPDPRLQVLADTPRLFRAVKVRLTAPGENGADPL